MRGFFITGTGTDVGKSVVTATLLRGLRSRGLNIAPMKPVQSGAQRVINIASGEGGEEWAVPDLDFSLNAAELQPTPEEQRWMAPYCYEPACSPHLAARMAGERPECSRVLECARQLCTRYDGLLVEGAGGIMVPINEDQLMLDLMKAFGFPVIIVALPGLGTINHVLLSIEAVRHAGLEVAGVIFNAPEPFTADAIIRDNPVAVEQFGKVPVLGAIGHYPEIMEHNAEAWNLALAGVTGFDRIRATFL